VKLRYWSAILPVVDMVLGIILGAVGIMALGHTAPFPFIFDVAAKDISIWRVPPSSGRKVLYLTFDDGPNPTATPELLDLLREKHVRSTFFLIDAYVNETTAPIVRRMFEEGHGVGQHSGDRWLLLHTPDQLVEQFQAEASRLELLAGHRPCPLFRPHGGWRSITMLRGLRRLHYKLAGWSWMTWDWYWFRQRTGPRVASQVISHAAAGKIIVIHDGHHRNPRADRRYAIDATRRIIDHFQAQGYEFATLCETP
jgi:peptidoglycan-N-acetylglucosamine deacetylase